ncbi:HIRAN domain-containing protein [Desemzia incerta]|uniref:HIRAN domain-containing protein n=1 Tax=Desemzia incerta TaxID=82801 RepID=UPI0024C42B85|nr:HIRAN domain-containing protein [Desemzia incerta]WHZ32737.1 HIRAN domain-containing protein [Desemzia incerta]
MNNHQSLWLVWQNPITRLNYHVATLSYTDNKYEFSYTWKSESGQKVKDALENGYMLHPSFPELQKNYVSNKLFAAFDRRLPSDIRKDYNQILEELNLNTRSTQMELLEQTRGKLSNDSYSFEKPLKLIDDKLKTSFFVNGMRYQQNLPSNWKEIIETTNIITLKLEPENPVDNNAVAVYAGMGIKLGFVPRFYSTAIYALIKRGLNPVLKIDYINDTATPDWWLKVNFESKVDMISSKELKNIDPLFEYAV